MYRIAASILVGLLLATSVSAAEPYVILPGFDDIPAKGPDAALGLVIWNHGVSGNRDQGAGPLPGFLRRVAAAGWDIVRIKRDGLQESNWTTGGLRHVARTIEEAESAQARGYKRIVLAGQSYGGAITLEAARHMQVYAIVPSAPGTGVPGTQVGSAAQDSQGTRHLYTSLADGRFERAVPILPFADEYALSDPDRGRRTRQILEGRAIAFLPMDDAGAWIAGHGGAYSPLMDFAYGECIVAFLDPARTPRPGAGACGSDGLPRADAVLPETAHLKAMKMEAGTWWQQYEGVWVGAWSNPILVSVAIERGADGSPEFVYLWGREKEAKLRTTYRVPASLDGNTVRAKLPHQDITLTFEMKTRQVVLRWRNAEGRTGSTLLRKYEPRA
jgi:pimeloyl-ACP methyl ester carboxylesterase